MSSTSSAEKAISAYPAPASMSGQSPDQKRPSTSSIHSSASSINSVASESEQPPTERRTRLERPKSGSRQKSSSFIIPKDSDIFQKERPQYPPDDARAMSPRRNSRDIELLEQGVRDNLKRQALTLQSSLSALAEKIDEVKSDHDRLENENRFLQDYIGGLTRTVSQEAVGRTSTGRKKGKK